MNDSPKIIEDLVPDVARAVQQRVEAVFEEVAATIARMEYLRRKAALDSMEVEELYGINAETLRSKRSRGGGPRFFRDGRLVRYRQEDLQEYIRDHMVRTSDQR